MGRIEVFSPAKINLFLSVLGRLESGFHELASLVAPVDFGDRVTVFWEAAEEASVELVCDDESLPTDRWNLAYAAAEGFLLRSGLSWRVRLELEKRIPQGAGLGGGSSNASAVLRGLSELAGAAGAAGLSPGELLELAAELGSDCPLFLRGKPLIMRGRGEGLAPLSEGLCKALAGREVLLFKPSFSIGTAWAYGALAETGVAYDAREWAEERLSAWGEGALFLEGLLHNSFESVAFGKFPAFEALFRRFEERGLAFLMSGSGSCCFVLTGPAFDVESLEKQIRDCWGPRCFLQRAKVLG